MSSWIYVAIGYFVYQIIIKAIEADRSTKIAKIEAKLKLELVQRLKDPDVVQQVLETRLSGAEVDEEDSQALKVRLEMGKQALAQEKARQRADSDSGVGGWLILAGLVTFLVGAAFLVTYFATHTGREFLLPGLICTAVGWALLAFSVYQKDQKKKSNAAYEEHDSMLPGEAVPRAGEFN